MVTRRRTTKTKVQKTRRVTKTPCAKSTLAKKNRVAAKVVIGRHAFKARVSCNGTVKLSRVGRKSYNTEKRKVKCACKSAQRKKGYPSRIIKTKREGAGNRPLWVW